METGPLHGRNLYYHRPVNDYPTDEQLRNAQPSWQQNPGGLRGDAVVLQNDHLDLNFPSAIVSPFETSLQQHDTLPADSPEGQGTPPASPFTVTPTKSGSGYTLTVDVAGLGILLSNPTDWTSQLSISNISSPLTWNGGDDLIWIDGSTIDLTDLSTVTVAIKSLGNGDTFTPGQITDDGGTGTPVVYKQIGFKKVIAAISSNGGSPAAPDIQQFVTTNLALEIGSLNSFTSSVIIAAVYPYPV